MSIRAGIAKRLRQLIAEKLNGVDPDYLTNLYGNVTNKVKHFSDINDFPYVSVTPGVETREDQPSNFSWGFLNLNLRIYVDNEEDAQGELETIISDLEYFLDNNLNIDFTLERPSGATQVSTTDITINQITTDEGILDPKGLGEISITVRYEKNRLFN